MTKFDDIGLRANVVALAAFHREIADLAKQYADTPCAPSPLGDALRGWQSFHEGEWAALTVFLNETEDRPETRQRSDDYFEQYKALYRQLLKDLKPDGTNQADKLDKT